MKKKNEVEKICYVVGKWNGGGVESVVMNYYKNIDRNKYQIDFLCDFSHCLYCVSILIV